MNNIDILSKERGKMMANEEQSAAVMKEMLPFFIYAAIPIIITICLAWTFGPSV